jgi:hypothetical protein
MVERSGWNPHLLGDSLLSASSELTHPLLTRAWSSGPNVRRAELMRVDDCGELKGSQGQVRLRMLGMANREHLFGATSASKALLANR